MLLTNIWSLAEYNPFNFNLIDDIEKLFISAGMTNCGRLLRSNDTDEYIVDPLKFNVRDLYERRTPKTHFFSIYNVSQYCPLPVGNITRRTMNDEDEIYDTNIDNDVRKRSLSVQMRLRPTMFETESFEYPQPIHCNDANLVITKPPRYEIRLRNGMFCVFDTEEYVIVDGSFIEEVANRTLRKLNAS